MQDEAGSTGTPPEQTPPATPPASDPPVSPPPPPPVEPTQEEAPEPFVDYTADSLAIPDDMEVDEAARDSFLKLANENKLPKAVVEQLVELQTGLARQASDRASQLVEQMQADWRKETEADPEIGGDKLEGVLSTIGKAIDQYGDDSLREAMEMTGAGNHPAVIRFVHKLASQLVETSGPVPGNASPGQQTAAQILFPNQGKN